MQLRQIYKPTSFFCITAPTVARIPNTGNFAKRNARISMKASIPEGPPPSISIKVDGGDKSIEIPSDSSDRILRNILKKNEVDITTLLGKMKSCNGGGQCGTCIVKIDQGMEGLTEKTQAEQRLLKGKPESWRLACQTIVESGEINITTKP